MSGTAPHLEVGLDEDAQLTCVGVRIGGWERLSTPQRIRARVESVEGMRRFGGGAVGLVFASGEVLVFVLRADPAEAAVALLDVLRRHEPGRRGTRVAVTGGSAGPRSGAEAVAESIRMLRGGNRRDHEAAFTFLLSDLLHWHVRDASPMPRFQRVRGEAFGPDRWVWPADAPPASARRVGRAPVRPRRGLPLTRARDHAAAMAELRRILRVRPGPEPLFALGECHLRLGERRAAVETWRYLLRRYPLTLAAYPLMDLEELDDVARAYLSDGLRIVRARPALAAQPERFEHDLLLALATRAYRRGRQRAGDRLVNEAAGVYPAGAAPLRVLAVEAVRRGDREGARRLLDAALARAPDRRSRGGRGRSSPLGKSEET
ncbi:tetratricopeptide repeat protein [Actinomadura sp. 3N407]|uniref:tetratricopeptide repeat protein n=1 Tax=Actinomadura sp. 3N407 TaxID=3457423 RepID=UPI003FCE795F